MLKLSHRLMNDMVRRAFLVGACAVAAPAWAATPGQRLAEAARRQVGVTNGYDPAYRRIPYPGGDVPRTTGVCADVPIRAARDALGLDLQRLVHEDMAAAFSRYPSRRAWGLKGPDANIDHRRVLNLETFWTRRGARLWQASGLVLGSVFPGPLELGDMLTWRLWAGQPHVGVVVTGGASPRVVHNIGSGAQEIGMVEMILSRAHGHYRWPREG